MNTHRTYEIISKYIGKKHDITIKYEPNVGPIVNLNTRTITIPSNLKDDTVYAGLAALMHEAAHIKHTPNDMAKAVVDDDNDMQILNCIEDTRIDHKNFGILPNIKSFYRDLYKDTYKELMPTIDKTPLPVKVLLECIVRTNSFYEFELNIPEVTKIIQDYKLEWMFRDCWYEIEQRNYPQVKKIVQTIKDILFKTQPKQPPQPTPPKPGDGDGKGSPDADPTPSKASDPGKNPSPNPTPTKGKPEDGKLDLSKVKAFTDYSGVFKNTDDKTPTATTVSPVALQEITKQRFSQLLNVKEKRTVNDGLTLNSDNLVSMFTGEIEELFTEDKSVHTKKSKLLFLLDSSGSMTQQMMDGQKRMKVLADTTASMVNIIKEIQEIEGLNVDYSIRCFDSCYRVLDKKTWYPDYIALTPHGSSTRIARAVDSALEEIGKDQSIDGSKLMIVFTDGQVHRQEITDMKQSVMRYNQDIRIMIIGIDAEPHGHLSKITPFNILSHDLADVEIMEASMELLS